jgi:hypothetical protein
MLRSSLHVPDAPGWRHEVGYAPTLVAPLTKAYHYLKAARHAPDGYFHAFVAVLPYQSQPMSVRQRLHVEYVLAQAYSGEHAYPQALDRLDAAAEMALFLHDLAAFAEVSFLAGAVCHQLVAFVDARGYYLDALAALRSLDQGTGPVDAALEIELLSRIAALNCELANFDHAAARLREAHLLLATWAPEAQAQQATLVWLEAVVTHWRGQPDQALPLAIAAADTLTRVGSANAAGRIQALVAEIALDFAETFPLAEQPRLREAFVRQARPYAERAIQCAREANDLTGAEVAHLVVQRCRRLSGRSSNGLQVAEGIVRKARRLGDMALLGRAYLSLGEELALRGAREGARTSYAAARHLFEEHDLRALRLWPNRMLLRHDEQPT